MTIHDGAHVDSQAWVDEAATVWPGAFVGRDARIGSGTVIGRNAHVDAGVHVGSNCKIQSGALLYGPAVLYDGVFIGPGAILTNDRHPRAVLPDGTLKGGKDWSPVGVVIREGASVGAGAILVAPVEVGPWAMVGAGAVVVANVDGRSLVVGCPARVVNTLVEH